MILKCNCQLDLAGNRRVRMAVEDVSCKVQDFGPQDIIDKIAGIYPTSKKGVEKNPPSEEEGLEEGMNTRLKVFSV